MRTIRAKELQTGMRFKRPHAEQIKLPTVMGIASVTVNKRSVSVRFASPFDGYGASYPLEQKIEIE